MVQGWVGLCGEFETWQRKVVNELGLSKSKPVSSPAMGDGATRCKSDELKPLDEEGERLYQRIVAKLNYLTHDRLDLKYATSCLASAVSSPGLGDMQGKTNWTLLEESTCCLAGFTFHDPRPRELLCYTDADCSSDKTSRRTSSGGVVTLGGGVLNCCALHCQARKASCSQPSRRAGDLWGQTVRASLITRSAVVTALHQSTLV